MDANFNQMLSGILFGGIGTAALLYGRKQGAWKPMVIGALLASEAYFIKSTVWMWVIGTALTGSLWLFRD